MSGDVYKFAVEIPFRDSAGAESTAQVWAEMDPLDGGDAGAERRCRLQMQAGEHQYKAAAYDFFEALSNIRLELEQRGCLQLLCYGASRNVFPSGMERDMGAGLHAYRMRNGQSVTAADLVETFGTGPDIDPSSVAEQRAYFETWWASFSEHAT